MGCFACLFPRRKEISSSRIEDSNVARSDPQFAPNSSLEKAKEKAKKPNLHEDHDCARSFTFRQLAVATTNFRETNLIGEGGFGRVYKGRLETGEAVAVKQLNREGVQGSKEFLVEVLMLSMLRHPNLVTLYGYCAEGDERLLVYEYMPQGSLEDHLFDLPPHKQPLEWNTRVKIAVGAAKGLTYLHEVANPPVIYRDMKAGNILLDDDFEPKLSDFGLAKLGPVGDKTHVSTRVMGTYGYCAPDYAMSGKLTTKSDVYSFGVLLLELLTGRRAFDSSKTGAEQNLLTWARPYLNDRRRICLLADPLLHGRFPPVAFAHLAIMTSMCLQDQPHVRPIIADLVFGLNHVASQPYIPEPESRANSSPSPSSSPSLQASGATYKGYRSRYGA